MWSGPVGVTIGGEPAAYIIENHLSRFVEGQDPRDVELMWDQMFRSTLNYGRKGLPIQAISAVDLALWDLLGTHYTASTPTLPYTRTHASTLTHTRIHTRTRTHPHTHTHAFTHTHPQIHTHTRTTYLYTSIYTDAHRRTMDSTRNITQFTLLNRWYLCQMCRLTVGISKASIY